MHDFSQMRREYQSIPLRKADLPPHPFQAFQKWFDEFLLTTPDDPNAVTIATASKQGVPSVRTVLMKGADESGFSFFTNLNSEKGQQLIQNPMASLLFYWPVLHRQIRIDGSVGLIDRAKVQDYFHSRPRDSQLVAYVSTQSQEIENKDVLEKAFLEAKAKFETKEVPLPETWGGFQLNPYYYEFWQGQPNRMHDRVFYQKKDLDWKKGRLAP